MDIDSSTTAAPPFAKLNVRAGTLVVTEILTRPYATITTVVTLGGDPSLPTSTTAPTLLPSRSSSESAQAPGTVGPAPSTSLTPAQLGALLGSVLGFTFLVFLCCYTAWCRHRRRRRVPGFEIPQPDNGGSGRKRRVPIRYYPSYDYYGRGDYDRQTQDPPIAQDTGQSGIRPVTSVWNVVPPPVWLRPTPRQAEVDYQCTSEAQISGAMRYR
ncbi:hypothetical protein VTJ83DRAFT_2762 [Remersonia thermophila]|uniref:Uncharacterized protein n=1 Tax=Remersonia thermophila TaxID=72144 RepID=A0ABR4DJM8_9PEZI